VLLLRDNISKSTSFQISTLGNDGFYEVLVGKIQNSENFDKEFADN